MDRSDLANLTAFVAVADQQSFRAAASRLGVTPSALSHSMRQFEERLGVRLLHRTTRSVSATDAGQRLLKQLRPAIDQIAGALENLNQERQRPRVVCEMYATSHLVGNSSGRADMGSLFVDLPGGPSRAPRGRRANRHSGGGLRRWVRSTGPRCGGYDCRPGHGTDENCHCWRTGLLRAATSATDARRPRPP